MRPTLTTLVAVVRSQGGAALAVGVVAVVVLSRVLPIEPVRVVGRPDVRTVVWPLVPALAALAVPIGAAARFREWTWVTARPAWQARAAFVATVALAGAVTVASVSVDRMVVARNLALFNGLALLAVGVLGRPTWALLVTVAVLVWFAGVDPPDEIRWWAVPLLGPDHVGAAFVALVVVTLGVVHHVVAPPSRRFTAGVRAPASRWRPPWRRPPRPDRPRRVGAGWP